VGEEDYEGVEEKVLVRTLLYSSGSRIPLLSTDSYFSGNECRT
jgi:hypothetical protein